MTAGSDASPVEMTEQVRIYRALPGQLEAFVEGWKELIVPLRESLGFSIGPAWALSDTSTFVWTVGASCDPAGFEEMTRRYYSAPARREIQLRLRPLLAHTEAAFAAPIRRP